MTPVRKRAKNTQTGSSYARAEDITGMLDPLISKEGFSRSLSCGDCPVEGHIRFVLTLRHIGGHEETHFIDAPPDYLGPKGAPKPSCTAQAPARRTVSASYCAWCSASSS